MISMWLEAFMEEAGKYTGEFKLPIPHNLYLCEMENKIVYVSDETLQSECNRLPTVLNRASLIQDLINSYKLVINENVIVVRSTPATDDELKYFHSSSYVDFLKSCNEAEDVDLYDDEQSEFGLAYDCPLLPKLYNLIRVLAGGSLTAAKLLSARKCKIAINWCGGWHHAQRDEAEGFCYVNDVVIAIQKLTETFPKILYLDLDVHHGNGVQNAFELSKKILTLSFHKYSPGFYPGSGALSETGCYDGRFYSLNVPLLEGCSDETYLKLFMAIYSRVIQSFKPLAIVVQCGADGINGDPVGQMNTTPIGMGQCIQEILKCQLPTLFLGGGGYNFTNTARYWTYLTSVIVGKTLENDIPDCCEQFTEYGPTYELQIDEGNQKDCNTEEYINNVIETIHSYCKLIETK